MRLRQFLLMALLPCLLAGDAGVCQAAKPVMAHYMPWYVSQPYSGSWKWHWTMDHFNPGATNAGGRRQIASWYYPLIGPYDSADPAVLEYHVLLMKLAGVDGVIVDWYGPDDFNDYAVNNQHTLALFKYARKAGLKFSLCYEDQTIREEVNRNYITAAKAVEHAQQAMLFAQTNFFTDSSFLRISNAPVLLDFGPQYFKNSSDWAAIFSVLDQTNRPAFFTEDNLLPGGAGAFDWPPMWLSGGGTNALTGMQLQGYFARFEKSAHAWPQFISSAFPRFHDIYAQAGIGGSYGYLDDDGGRTFTTTLTRAITNNSAMVQVVTWNDFGEGTVVEPTAEYGYRDLGTIQDLKRKYLDPGFSYRTNDLATAWHFYNLRKQLGKNPEVARELDRIFTNIISGNISLANSRLASLEESNHITAFRSAYNGMQIQ